MTTHAPTRAGTTGASARFPGRVAAVAAAVVSALLVWGIAGPLAGVDLRVATGGRPPMEITWVPVMLTGLVVSLAGWGLLALLERFTARARAAWTVVALVVLLASFAPVLTAQATTGTRVSLAVMHVAVAAALIPLLARTSSGPAGGAQK